jgi:hypothetical protein
MAPKGKHTRSTSLLPLATSKSNLEEIIRKGKTAQKVTSTDVPSFSDNLHNPSLPIPITVYDPPIIQTVGVSRNLILWIFPSYLSPPVLGLEGNIFDTPFSLECVKWKERNLTLEYFPTLDITIPPIRIVVVIEGETFFTFSYSSLSPSANPFPFSPRNTTPVFPVQAPYSPGSPPVHIPMEGANRPRNRMAEILATSGQNPNPISEGYYEVSLLFQL